MTTNVLNLPGDYTIVVDKSNGLVTVSGDTQLGKDSGNTIDTKAEFISSLIPRTSSTYNLGTETNSWNIAYIEKGRVLDLTNVENRYGRPYDPLDMYDTPAHRNTASLYVSGGVGIEKDLNVGGFIYGRIETANTALSILTTVTNIDIDFFPTFVLGSSTQQIVFVDGDGTAGGLRYNPYYGKLKTDRALIAETEESVSTTTGALVVAGGVGIAGTMTIGGDILPAADITGQIGHTSTQWAEAYVHDIYTRLITSTTGTVEINPHDKLTDIFGDIRVRGVNPIGTAPMVTNTLFVTVDGDDTNDGRALDASRACRTISGATNSPYFQPGTQILVAAGRYLEDNPIRLKPYTSVRGSDIRTTFIEPINKTQDLFHLESGCYLNYMTFLNGRSGLLKGQYAPGYNRGAYATAFPPQSGDNRIDLFHSPYVQNCTNQSGPWLTDGTMFVPSQTVQVPAAVAVGTWPANTTTIEVTTFLGTITNGMYINGGAQNPGFFSARTLLLANKPFLQEQVVDYINQQIADNIGNTNSEDPGSIWWDSVNSRSFQYNQEKCRRDVGILVENIAYDAAFGGNQKAVESGLSYWKGVVSVIAGQENQTTSAIEYLRDRMLEVITNTPCTNTTPGGTYSQVRNTVLLGGSISTSSITYLVSTITNIINNGPDVAPEVYTSTGPDAAFVSAEILMQANRKFIQEDTVNYINNLIYDIGTGGFPYSEIKCRRDVGLIVDSISLDLLYDSTTQSNFAGLQYWNQSGYTTSLLADEITTTTSAIQYLKELCVKIIQNITPTDDLIDRFQTTYGQDTVTYQKATTAEVNIINPLFNTILDIIKGKNKFWTDSIISNGDISQLISVQNAVGLLINNREYMQEEVNAYVRAPKIDGGLGFTDYAEERCKTDIGYIIDCIAFDLQHGGNRQSIQAGVYYLGFDYANGSSIAGQIVQTTNAFNHLSAIAQSIVQNIPVGTLQDSVKQLIIYDSATSTEASAVASKINILNNIINDIAAQGTKEPISLTMNTNPNVMNAYKTLLANKQFIIEEVISFIDQTYNPGRFNYNEALCYRDTGLIVDAVSQDILLGGNQKSIEAGLAYWNFGFNHVAGQETTTTMAINYARDLALQIIANVAVTPQAQTSTPQIINPFYQYGGDYMPQEAVTRNFGIITDIIERGPLYAPPSYAGGGLFSLTGLNGSDVKISPTVTNIEQIDVNQYRIGLSSPTVGFGNDSTLYFGDILIYPLKDSQVEEKSLEYTGDATTWNARKVDSIGSMGGSLVDGGVISDRSPIQSFVYDAFTQVNQGGRGVHITNDGYAQLVSVFTIFCSVGVQTDNGGIASIVNSNANFGDICLLATGYGTRKFSGTVYNPRNRAYPSTPGPEGFDQYFPDGFWPNNGRMEVFIPDIEDRPHISLVMEVVPPDTVWDGNAGVAGAYVTQENEQGFPGFLNAAPNTGTLTTSTIVLTGIDTTGIAVGNYLYIRDQDNNTVGRDGNPYAATGTQVTEVGYLSITLNLALTSGGTDPLNTGDLYNNNYFSLYFCGNAYYTVLSSDIATNPRQEGVNILSSAGLTSYDPFTGLLPETPPPDQVDNHIAAIEKLTQLIHDVVSNTPVTPLFQTTEPQILDPMLQHGSDAITFIDLRFGEMLDIIKPTRVSGKANTITDAESIIKPALRTKSGPAVQGGGDAITIIKKNINFLTKEVSAYVQAPAGAGGGLGFTDYDDYKCQRDVGIILQRLIYDIQSGGRYNSVMTGLSYWSKTGTHHIIQLGENVTRTDLFPDGSTVNFYQRSYISASGYVFEYVGAGTNYGALPQRGVADPVQGKEVVQLDSGKVFFTSSDQNGDFRIGPGLVISQATGVLSGRTFTKSLFANMTPFMLAIEGGGILG